MSVAKFFRFLQSSTTLETGVSSMVDLDGAAMNNSTMNMTSNVKINAFEYSINQMSNLQDMLNTVWMVIVSIMTILAQVGYLMVEIGSIKTHNNSDLLLKNLLVMAISSVVFFLIGFGISTEAGGGLMGKTHFLGYYYTYTDYSKFLFHYSLCILMASIATGPIAERTSLDTYVFFTFLTSAFIFPTILAWCWEDGWL